jgi:hypothetical protein
MRRIRPLRPSPALAVASLALFLALGGVGYAALNIPAGSIKSSHLAKGSVKKSEIARNAVGRNELATAAVTSAELATGAVTDMYAAYLQPNAGSSSINVGWQSRSFEAPTLVYNGSGRYTVTFAREEGLGCAVPAAMAFDPGSAVTFRVVGLACNAQQTTFELATSNGQNVQFLLQVAFT